MNALEALGLGYTYQDAERPALDGIDFEVAAGEVFGFLGPSGAGKSTTQKLLIGLLSGHEGTIRAFGRPLADWGADYFERIGVAFEYPNHFLKLTAIENLDYFGRLYRGPCRPAEELLAAVNLAEDGNLPVAQFSKGMKVRLSVARALMHGPELLFLDEPTAGLDPTNARRIRDLIRAQVREGRTVFLTTHDMALAHDLCDRVAFIVEGRIALVDRPRDLERRYGQARVRVEIVGADGPATRDFELEGLGGNEDFLALLRGGVRSLRTLEASLEDVFIQVTGRSLH